MECAEIEAETRRIAEEFQLILDTVSWRQKKSYITARVSASRIQVILRKDLPIYPDEFIQAAIYITFSRLTRNTQSPKYHQLLNYIKNYQLAQKKSQTIEKILPPAGICYDLKKIAAKVLTDYVMVFKNYFENYSIHYGWSSRKSFRRLAYFNPTYHIIVVSPIFDRFEVPQYVVEYLIYHELLHAFLGISKKNGKRAAHTPEFHQLEKLFMHYELTNHFLTQYTMKVRKTRKVNS
jgi:predicted metallopeptidase